MVHSPLWKRLGIMVACMLLMIVSLPLIMQPKTAFAQQEMISINPTQGSPGTKVTVTGTGWNEHASRGIDVPIQISASGSQPTQVADPLPDASGNFIVTFIVPTNMPTGQLTVSAIIGNGGSADAWFTITANTPTVIVQKVFTADSNNNAKTTFVPGDPIHYMVEAQNTSSTAVTATVTYHVTGPQPIYDWSGSASLASGPLRFYSAPTIPTNAPAGTYTITVTISYNGVNSSGQNQFTVATSPATWSYDAGNYQGKSSSVSVGNYREPDGSKYYNYCGPGASQILISAWTSNIPDIDTLAIQEKTNQGKTGTYMTDMVKPINDTIGQNYYATSTAHLQAEFSNMIGKDILDHGHPLITGLQTRDGNNDQLIGWNKVSAPHIITITGFDFTSPTQGWISYTETASAGAGATAGPGSYRLDYNTFWALVQANPTADIQLHGN